LVYGAELHKALFFQNATACSDKQEVMTFRV
jgi:hypothetical protein